MDNAGNDIKSDDLVFVTNIAATTQPVEAPIVLYKRRWVILAIFSLISMMNEVIWISLSSVASILEGYYKVSASSINWVAMIFSTMYVTVILSVFILNKYGLKVTIVGGALCNTLASVSRLVGYKRNGYIYALLGNAFGGMGQSFLIFIPPTLSSVWFGDKERARASSIGMLMNMLGVAVGFLMGSLFVPNSTDYEGVVKKGMFTTLLIQAIVCGVLLILSIIFIQKVPETPPSHSQIMDIKRRNTKHEIRRQSKAGVIPKIDLNRENSQSTGFFKNWKMLATNLMFHLLSQAYGLYFGLFVAVSTLLNQMVTQHFPGKEQQIGMMGFASVIAGLIAIMLAGVWIDKTHRYKFISVGIYFSCLVSFLLFIVVLRYSKSFAGTFVCFCIYGFCSYPYLSVGLEYIAEVLYPIKESILSFICLFIGSLYGVLCTYAFGFVIEGSGADKAGYAITALYLVGFLCVVFVKGELKRYQVDCERNKARG